MRETQLLSKFYKMQCDLKIQENEVQTKMGDLLTENLNKTANNLN